MEQGSDTNKGSVERVGELSQKKTSITEPPEDKHLVRVAAYCRVSTDLDKQMDSLAIQKKHFKSRVHNAPDWQLVGIYTDEGVTGTNISQRKGFKRMLRHCEEGKIDKILCKSISRFGRNTADILNAINSLKEKNISIFFEKENIDTLSINSDFVLSTIASIAQDESRSISENVKWSLKRRFQQGQPSFVRIIGYNVERTLEGKIISINQEEAAIVQEIFDLFLQGVTQTKITLIMMENGYRTVKGKREWDKHMIRNILSNEKYTGDVLCQKTYKPDYLSNKRKKNNGERQQYLIEGHHPAIISHETFEKAQLLLSLNRRGVYRGKKTYPLSGRIICGECGAIYCVCNNSRDLTWRCSRSIKSQKLCDATTIHESLLRNVLHRGLEAKYGISNQSIIYRLKSDIFRVQENDNFEKQRMILHNKLSAALKIEKRASDEEHKAKKAKRIEIEAKIKQIERYWNYIEEDRKFRTRALEWLETLPRSGENTDVILQNLDVDFMRALAVTITVFSDGSYLIRWADDTKAKVNDDNLRPKKRNYKEKKARVQEYKSIEDGMMRTKLLSQAIRISPHNPSNYKPITLSFPAIHEYPIDVNERPQKKVCAYCRVSTNQNDQLSSFELQITHYTDLIRRNPSWKFSGIYADRGASGTSIHRRSNFLHMIDDCKAGKIDLIITKSISRFARNTVDCLTYVKMLKSLPIPVGIYFERENLFTLDEKSSFLLIILSGLAQEESRSLSESLRWGIQRRYEYGIVTLPIHNLLGYDIDKLANWTINEEQAETVRRIYGEFLAGKTHSQIAKDLMADGIKTGAGKSTWWASGLYQMLLNEKYCGDILLQKFIKPHYMDHHRVRNTGQQAKYFVENHHTGIISKDEWDAVQIEINRRGRLGKYDDSIIRNKSTDTNVFYKMIYCGNCGNYFASVVLTSRGKQKYQYTCWKCRAAMKRVPNVECHMGSYREEEIENTFMAILLDMKKNQDALIKEAEIAIKKTALTDNEVVRMSILQEEIKSLYKNLTQIGRSSEQSEAANNLSDMIIKLSCENEVLQSELEELDNKLQTVILIESNLKWLLKELNALKEGNPVMEDIDFRPDIFRRIVERCIVSDNSNILFELNIGVSKEISFTYIENRFRKKQERQKLPKRGNK